jgi:hypothetical protein
VTAAGCEVPDVVEVRALPLDPGLLPPPPWIGRPEAGFVIEGVSDGRYALSAAGGRGLYSEPVNVTVAYGECDGEPKIVLRQGGMIVGTLTGLDGGPCPSARVRITPLGDADAAGRDLRVHEDLLRLGPLAGGRYRIEATSGPGRASGEVEVEPGKEARLDLVLDCGRAFSVTVTDAAGAGVRDATVTIRDAHDEVVRAGSRNKTDYRGYLLLHPVPPGEYRLEIVGPAGRCATASVRVRETELVRVEVTLE